VWETLSGTNVAVVVGAALLLSRLLGFGLVGAPAVSALALLAFVVLARPSPSVLRAAVMGVVGLAALLSGSRRAALPSLCAAVLLLVLLAPDLASAPGFALSVLATAGLVVLAPRWRDRLATRMPGWLADALAVPAAAQVACGPVIVAISGRLGLLSVPANLLAVPAVAPATVLGVVAALLAPVCLPLAQAVAWLAWLPTAWLVLIARTGASLPGAAVGWPAGQRGAVLLVGTTVVVALVLVRRASRRMAAASAAGVLVAVAGLQTVAPSWPPPGWFLVACDVGQGDAVVLNVGGGSAVVVDAGPEPATVDRCLDDLDVDRVPLVLLTHLHADHVDGLPGVLRGRSVGVVEIGPLDDPEQQRDDVVGQAREAEVPVQRAALGEERTVGPLRWVVLAPARPYRGTSSDPNNSSLVLRLRVGTTTVLLTGDIEPAAQQDLLDRGVDVRAQVLKVPHHGSDHQNPAFLDAVGASVALTSVGAGNAYGHPSAGTIARLIHDGARSFRTDLDGDVALVHRDGRLGAVGRHGRGVTAREGAVDGSSGRKGS
jgi:competence protein ComEC